MADTCQAYRALIEAAAGRPVAPAGALGAHLDACAACRGFRRERESLVSLLGGLGSVAAPEDFEFRLRARMARRRASEKSLLRRFTLAPALAAAAVTVCVLAAAAVYLRTQPGSQTVAHAPAPAVSAPAAGVDVAGVGVESRGQGESETLKPETPTRAGVAAASSTKRSGARSRRLTRESSFGVREASVIKGEQVAAHTATGAVPLQTSPETLRVVLRDEHGGAYVLPMRSVSFGAQGPVARGARPSDTNKEGVW